MSVYHSSTVAGKKIKHMQNQRSILPLHCDIEKHISEQKVILSIDVVSLFSNILLDEA